jgi:hypothetical protein
MDLSFFRRAEARLAGATPARLDFGMFVAALNAAAPAAHPPAAGGSGGGAAMPRDPLAEILLGGPCWREAVAAQGGSFYRAVAGKGRVN